MSDSKSLQEQDMKKMLAEPHNDSEASTAIKRTGSKSNKKGVNFNAKESRSKSEITGGKYPRRHLKTMSKAKTELSSGGEVHFKQDLFRSKSRTHKSKFEEATMSDSESKLSEMTRGTKIGDKKSKSSRTTRLLQQVPGFGRKKGKKRGGVVTSTTSAGSANSRTRSRGFSKPIRDSLADISFIAQINKKKPSIPGDVNLTAINQEADSFMSKKLIRDMRKVKSGGLNFGGFDFDDFDCFKRKHDDMIAFFPEAFLTLELSVLYNDDKRLMDKFLRKVQASYKPREQVAFHSFYHGFSVAQMATYFVLRNSDLKGLFDKKTLYTFVVAALCHDIDHPGTSNYYEVASKSKNAKMFENKSVLESHHTITTLNLLTDDKGELNVFKYLDTESQARMSELLVEFILATDMSKHKEHLEFLKGLKDLDIGSEDEDYETKLNLLKCVIHACDLSGQCFSQDLAATWEENIHFEMLNEFRRLKKHKLEVPKHLLHLESDGDVLKQRFKSQSGFIKFVLVPYWAEIARLFPEAKVFLDNLKRNQKFFEEGSK